MSSMLYSKYNIDIWNFHIIAFCFYSQFVQCPNFYGIGFVHLCNIDFRPGFSANNALEDTSFSDQHIHGCTDGHKCIVSKLRL